VGKRSQNKKKRRDVAAHKTKSRPKYVKGKNEGEKKVSTNLLRPGTRQPSLLPKREKGHLALCHVGTAKRTSGRQG